MTTYCKGVKNQKSNQKTVCRIKPLNYSHFDYMFRNNWSKYNTEQFFALYTKWGFKIIYSFIRTEFDILILH